MITMLSLVTTYQHTNLLQYYWLISHIVAHHIFITYFITRTVYLFFIVYTITDVPISPPLPTSTPHTPPSFWPSPHCVCVCGLHIHVLWLTLSPSFIQYPLFRLTALSLLHVFMPLVLFCLSVFCSLDSTCKWDHIVFVSDWLILLSIIISRSIYAIAKDKIIYAVAGLKPLK